MRIPMWPALVAGAIAGGLAGLVVLAFGTLIGVAAGLLAGFLWFRLVTYHIGVRRQFQRARAICMNCGMLVGVLATVMLHAGFAASINQGDPMVLCCGGIIGVLAGGLAGSICGKPFVLAASAMAEGGGELVAEPGDSPGVPAEPTGRHFLALGVKLVLGSLLAGLFIAVFVGNTDTARSPAVLLPTLLPPSLGSSAVLAAVVWLGGRAFAKGLARRGKGQSPNVARLALLLCILAGVAQALVVFPAAMKLRLLWSDETLMRGLECCLATWMTVGIYYGMGLLRANQLAFGPPVAWAEPRPESQNSQQMAEQP